MVGASFSRLHASPRWTSQTTLSNNSHQSTLQPSAHTFVILYNSGLTTVLHATGHKAHAKHIIRTNNVHSS